MDRGNKLECYDLKLIEWRYYLTMDFTKTSLFKVFRLITLRRKVFGKIGKNNKFTQGVYINNMAIVGNYNYFGPYSMVNNAVIGNYCSIAPGVKIGQGEHSIDFITTYNNISSKLINFSLNQNSAKIGNDVWIGANAIIKQGVKIGDGAVIGAGAVVTKDIPDYAIAIGVPVKVIRYRFEEKTIKEIKKTQWWNYDIKKAMNIIDSLYLK
jgi:virginiamycin A acetyltransferase